MPVTNPILSFENLKKSFLNQIVVDDISFGISAGDIAIILGANGAGKTTLIKIAVGLSKPDKGKVIFNDSPKNVFSKSATYLGHESMLYQDLTVSENIELMIKLRKLDKNLNTALTEWHIQEYASKKISELSRGMKYRAALCKAFLHDPIYIFLDEPSSALDQNSLELLSGKIKIAVTKKNGFAFIVTHDIERLSQIANRFVVLDQGKVAFDSDSLQEDLMSVRNKAVDFYHKTNR